MIVRKDGGRALADGKRLPAEIGEGVVRLIHEAERATRRAEEVLALAKKAGTEGDGPTEERARRQAIAMIDDLGCLCDRLKDSQRTLADTLMMTCQFQTALAAYKQADKEEDLAKWKS